MLTPIQGKRLLAVGLTLLLGAAATSFAWKYAHDVHLDREARDFADRLGTVRDAIAGRFIAYEQVLRSGVALFQVNPEVSREQWRDFVSGLDTQNRFPGIQGIGYAERLSRATLPKHLARVRADGFPEYAVYPPLPHGGEGSAIVFLEPFDARNQRSFGYDMYSHPVRREAMARARDTGKPALSGHVVLLQETEYDRQAGTLLYLPVYRQGMPLDSVIQRRQALRGWVYGPFRMKDLMRGILGDDLGNIRLQLFDGRERDAENLLFHSQSADEFQPQFQREVNLELAGRPWLLSMAMSDPSPDTTSALVGLGGSMLTLLLAALMASITRSEQRSAEMALDMTEALRNSEARQRAILQSTADGILTLSATGAIQSFNHAAEQIFGYLASEVVGKDVTMLMPERFRQAHPGYLAGIRRRGLDVFEGMRREVTALRKNGEEFPLWVAVSSMPSQQGGSNEFVALLSDISHRKKSEKLLAEAHNQRRNILLSAPFAIISTDEGGRIQTLNPAAEKLLQYSASELVGIETPVCLHDPDELFEFAAELSRREGRSIHAGFEALVTHARRGQTEEREWTYLRKDGQRVPVQATVNALTGVGGAVEGFLICAFDITERKNAQSYVQHLAHHDPLTSLPNRVLLLDRLDQAIKQARRQDEQVAVLMVDLDHFKRINDSLGHHVGDDLLLAVSDRLSRAVRRADTVARMGGDEFVMVLPGVKNRRGVRKMVGPLLEKLSVPFRVQDHEMTVTPSIGVALFPEHGEEARSLLKHADTAMYQAKEAGRATYRFFDPEMLQENKQRLEIENALRKALDNQELSLTYQPQVDFRTGEVMGCEALLRWRSARLGDVSPGTFIPLAEEMGLILPIGEWVLYNACREASEMQKQLGIPIHVAVNISPRQFFQADLPDVISAAIHSAGLPPSCLEIEITEGVLVTNAEETIEQLRAIRRLGVQVAIDDFGTGYSSLAYLTSFPIDKLKIDQTFVRDITVDPNDAAVTSAVIVMAHTLQLKVVAEGVENQEQYAYLAERGCDIAQGYYFGRPLSRELFIEHAAKNLRQSTAGPKLPLHGSEHRRS